MTAFQKRTLLSLFMWPVAAQSGNAADPDNCLLCHQYRGLSRLDQLTQRVHVYFVDPDYTHFLKGPHARLACTDCHAREEVSVIPHREVAPVDCTRTCHLAHPDGPPREFSHRHLAQLLERSVHRPQTLDQLQFTGGALLEEGQSHCLYCHDEPLFRGAEDWPARVHPFRGGVFDRCESCHTDELTVDVAYYVQHIAARLQPARPTMELAQVCAVCHSDPQVRRHADMHDAVASYMLSFHGRAALLGEQRTADCLNCHSYGRNVHNVLAGGDPRSPVHPERVADTCSAVDCHPRASPDFGSAAVHLDLALARGTVEFFFAACFILLTVFTFAPSALLAVLELLQSVVGRGHSENARMHALAKALHGHPVGHKRLVRFTVPQRVQHWILAILFILLALTGFPMKFADTAWARQMIHWFGGLENARLLHHWSGLALVIGFAGHLGYVITLIIRRSRQSMGDAPIGYVRALTSLPMWIDRADLRKLKELLLYLLFLRAERPRFGRFSLKEKFEYLGVFWGTMILGITGVVLWAEQFASHIIGGRALTFATIFHTYEAFLAMIHVGILHIYSVILSPHVFPLSPAMLTGTTPAGELAEGHAEYVEDTAGELGIRSEWGDHHE